ncbi:S60 ribosomal protein L36 [Dictyostelium discoideum AX4]|uniref:Large ribosomal subunit protein eL36 n=1 Tax=Dictyostelium discoideum TaxID=44689 RepID=RL36_DICDI|nr:S60 ribosomal protein L36 [Dictyostelium discoideum AX4]Q55AQ9.1 RecName: Full=Large ribosomal subunit protein eL36; AltName: Full=60S ribosomal protein L36 [Dictyostelium discoideum]AAG32534.1 ribosomal protein L36 [Dictyostelium discoideum]EAL71524.1 S60 ribosomal protein L36 [Dictyostelium discoideum AX4]|eukprot:XP_645463.1 S60 ribosomal protein L36 [Dictyostelium discoideum AX4]
MSSAATKPVKRSGIIKGFNKGHAVAKRTVTSTFKKQVVTKRVAAIRDVIREISGFSPYERRVSELLKSGLDKRALKVAKKRLGSIQAGKKKRDDIANINRKASAK